MLAGFEFAEGSRFQAGAQGTPNEVGSHLELLRKQCKGELTPVDVLEDAKNPNSPLHSYFEWDDSAAAHQYRLKQARGLIRAVVAVYTAPDQPATRVRAYVHVPEPGAHHYRSTPHALSQRKTRELVLQAAWREFQSFRRKYQDLKEFAAIFEAADRVQEKLPPEVNLAG